MSNENQWVESMQEKAKGSKGFGGVACIQVEGHQGIIIDGRGEQVEVRLGQEEVDVTLRMNQNTLEQIMAGELDGMTAFFQGLLEIDGSQRVAMAMGDLLS